jgi:D-alanyl-D-alanine carboxypeptidase (penicillin-binding protein 5/6)
MIFPRTTDKSPRDRSGLRFRAGRTVASLLSAAALVVVLVGAPSTALAAPGDPYVPPSETVQTPSTDDCARRDQPPPAVDTSEDVPPGATAPTPLPVPATPVGGGRMGECGVIVPAGAPALPSDISAGSWMVADLDTGEILAAKDPHGRYRPASTLKLLTAQVMLKNLTNLDLTVEGTQADTAQDGTRVGLEAGGIYTVRQLLSYLVMISGNDAANALARTNGGYDKTVADMNATALALGALDTRAATPSGLDGPGQSTSAYDLALFARKDMATPPFAEMISAQDVRVPGSGNEGYIAANDNQLLYQYPGALGGKTGFTDDAGNTYVGMAERNGRRLVVTMMNGNHVPRRQWMQAASLLDWGFALPSTTPPVGQLVGSLAEATSAPAPTPSIGPPTASGAAGVTGSAGSGAVDTGVSTGAAVPTAAAAPTTGGLPTAVIVLAGIGVLVLILGVGLLVRRRHLNKRAAFAGDAKPADSAAGDPVTGETAADETNADETTPGETNADETTPDESTPDEPAADETAPADTGRPSTGAAATGAVTDGASDTPGSTATPAGDGIEAEGTTSYEDGAESEASGPADSTVSDSESGTTDATADVPASLTDSASPDTGALVDGGDPPQDPAPNAPPA